MGAIAHLRGRWSGRWRQFHLKRLELQRDTLCLNRLVHMFDSKWPDGLYYFGDFRFNITYQGWLLYFNCDQVLYGLSNNGLYNFDRQGDLRTWRWSLMVVAFIDCRQFTGNPPTLKVLGQVRRLCVFFGLLNLQFDVTVSGPTFMYYWLILADTTRPFDRPKLSVLIIIRTTFICMIRTTLCLNRDHHSGFHHFHERVFEYDHLIAIDSGVGPYWLCYWRCLYRIWYVILQSYQVVMTWQHDWRATTADTRRVFMQNSVWSGVQVSRSAVESCLAWFEMDRAITLPQETPAY